MKRFAVLLLVTAACGGAWKSVRVYRDYRQVQEIGCSPIGGDQIIAPPRKALKIAHKRGANAIHIQRDIGEEVVADAYVCP